MFEDEMTEDHAVRTDDEYRRIVEAELHEEKMAQAKATEAVLNGLAIMALRNRIHQLSR